ETKADHAYNSLIAGNLSVNIWLGPVLSEPSIDSLTGKTTFRKDHWHIVPLANSCLFQPSRKVRLGQWRNENQRRGCQNLDPERRGTLFGQGSDADILLLREHTFQS